MALSHKNSLVFVGGEFPVEAFDERSIFGGALDRGAQVKTGPVGQFSYASGTYQFEVTPPRIDLKHQGEGVIPSALVEAANTVAAVIEPARGFVHVSGFGINCDTVFDRKSIGTSGQDFCFHLINDRLTRLVDSASGEITARIRFEQDDVRYDVRIEPVENSDGENLFVAVNCHQSVQSGERLASKFEAARLQTFRDYVSGLHRRITDPARSA